MFRPRIRGRLRSEPTVDCCCHEATLDGSFECLPVPPHLEGDFIVNGTYTESTVSFPEGDFKEGKVDWDAGMQHLWSLRTRIRAADPKHPDMTFDWEPQWDWDLVECLGSKYYPVIGEEVEGASLLQSGPNPIQQAALRLLALSFHVYGTLRKSTNGGAASAGGKGTRGEGGEAKEGAGAERAREAKDSHHDHHDDHSHCPLPSVSRRRVLHSKVQAWPGRETKDCRPFMAFFVV